MEKTKFEMPHQIIHDISVTAANATPDLELIDFSHHLRQRGQKVLSGVEKGRVPTSS